MKHFLIKTLVVALLGMALTLDQAVAAKINVTVKNLTNGIYFTPLFITAHKGDTHLFEVGVPASEALQAMAEGGDISLLSTMIGGADKDTVENPAGGLLGPGEMVSDIILDNRRTRNRYLSLGAMMLPTNDGFVGLDSLLIPRIPGIYRYYLSGYDAGTEANDELVNGGGAPGVPGIPAAPGEDAGFDGTGASSVDINTTVHIHRGVIGDVDLEGGISDLDSTVHRWLNPVAEVVLEISRSHFEKD